LWSGLSGCSFQVEQMQVIGIFSGLDSKEDLLAAGADVVLNSIYEIVVKGHNNESAP
jgi:hypothetical protein